MDINLYEYIFQETKEGKSICIWLNDGFTTDGMGDNGYRFQFDEALFSEKLTLLFNEWIHGYLYDKLAHDCTYGVGKFEFEINDNNLQLNCITELGGSFYEFEYCCLSDDVLSELFKNHVSSDYSYDEVFLNFKYEFNYISNTWKISGFENSHFSYSTYSSKEFDFSKIDIDALKLKIHEEIKDYSLEQIGLEKGNISKEIISVESSITVSEYISFIIPVVKS